MKEAFDFDTPLDRAHSDSYKWTDDDNLGAVPMWVADMDFATAPVVRRAVMKRAEHGAFGYVKIPEDYYDTMQKWYLTRHEWAIDKKDVIVTTGVVPAISAVIQALVPQGSEVIVQTPAYNCFFSSIRNAGCKLLENRLKRVDGRWAMDFDDLREKVKKARLLILCNPHNPVGRAWTKDELIRLAGICREAGVTVLSDEIHGEFVYSGYKHTAFASLDKALRPKTVIATSASKAFNTAGLHNAVIVAEDEEQYRLIDRQININEVCDASVFGVAAATAAWSEGGQWLDALTAYLEENDRVLRKCFADVLGEDLKYFPMTPLEATYLEWIDCGVLKMTSDEIEADIKRHEKVRINAGSHYVEGDGNSFIRINIACPRERVLSAATAVANGLKRLLRQKKN